jgi:uncharacterized membrane protein YfcA
MSVVEMAGLAAAAAAAGAVNAVAGGGTLLTFPALLAVGTPALTANATSTLALVIGTAGSVFGYREPIRRVRPWLRRFLPVSLLGGLLGGILLTRTDERVFAWLVPFLLLFATLVFLAQGAFRRFAFGGALRHGSPAAPLAPAAHVVWVAVLFQFGVALYGGYFGAGIGILMLASLGCLGLADIHEMNGLKTVLGSLINLVAAVWFIGAGLIDWPKAGVMTIGALAGYFLGAHYSQRIPQQRVRQLITAIGLSLSAVLFYRQFGPR